MKRLTSILLCLALILNIFSFSVMAEENYNFSDEQQALLTAIGMLNENLVLSDKVTRAEFADMLVHSVFDNPEYLIEGTETFNDVAVTHDYYSSIMLLKNLEVTLGDGNGNFKPEEKILSNDAVVMAIRFLGYSKIAQKYGNLAFASSKGITKGVVYAADEELSLYNALLIVFNVLNVDVTDQYANQDTAATFLTGYRNIYAVKGVVTDDGIINQYGISELAKDEIAINGVVYKNKTSEMNLFGASVKGYFRTNGTDDAELIAVVKTNDNATLILDSKNIEKFDVATRTYHYRENRFEDDTEEVEVPANITIIYNGVPLGIDDISITKEDFVPATGSVVLYDSDGDNKYDFLYIYSYETYIVSTVDTDKEIIYLKEYKKPIELREYNADILDNQSNPVELANIKEKNIISVLSSLSGDLLKVYVSDEMISDVVVAKDTDGTITTQNNGSFELADSYMKTGGLDKLEFTTLYKMCIDVFGDIAYAEHDNINLWNTAILINAANNSRSLLSENFEISLYTLEGKMIVLKPAKKVIILKSDNTKVRLEDEDAIEEIYNYAQANLTSGNRMIRYKLNMQGELCEIEFALSTNVELSEINENRLFVIHDASTTKTTFAGGTFVGKVILNTGVKVVVMPDEITTNEKDYAVTDGSMFVKNKGYNIIAYGTNTTLMSADYITVTQYLGTNKYKSERSFIISNIVETYDHNEDQKSWKIKGFEGVTEVTYYIDDESVFNGITDLKGQPVKISEGDILNCSLEAVKTDRIVINNAYILYDADGKLPATGKGMFGSDGIIAGSVSEKLLSGTDFGNPVSFKTNSDSLTPFDAVDKHIDPYNNPRITIGFVYSYDANQNHIVITTQPINSDKYKSLKSNNNEYITETYSNVLSKTLHIKKYANGTVKIRKAAVNDIKPYTVYGQACSKVVFVNYSGLFGMYIIDESK